MEKKKKGAVTIISVLILALIFTVVATFTVNTLVGSKSNKDGISGASDRINNTMINEMP